ncbi:hypothetical protein [Methanosphaera sp. WGK6]|uniref:hypothetical protein n=1 Tax=Methanosphaera sp. WGK6 TaxID=1561964 RepID=UPI00084C9F45|nr:hypothetical protein [Methanosphaera sp. WGK6]OED29707.1 membrane protein [Methanosphaera sp. WGK6]
MVIAFTEDQIFLLALAIIFLIAIIVIVVEWRKSAVSRNNVTLLERQMELKKIELVEKDLENKRMKENMSELSKEDQEKLQQIRINTSEIMGKVGLLSTEVNERVEQLEAKSELLKLQKLAEKLDKKEAEIEKSLKK